MENKEKMSIPQLSQELKPLWKEYLDKIKTNYYFCTKLCYETKGEVGIRCFPSELSKVEDIFIELHDWDQENYHKEENKRVLYVIKAAEDWKTKYKKLTGPSGDSYFIDFSDLIVVKTVDLNTVKFIAIPPVEEELVVGDAHLSSMTIRDLYCIIQNTPKSNKLWLNKLINNK